MTKKIGTWECWQLDGTRGKIWIGFIHGTADIWGDELYDWMSENIDGFDADSYEYEGDETFVAVMGKTKDVPEYYWEFKPAQEEPVQMVKRPQSTRNYL